jgi:glutaredoxin
MLIALAIAVFAIAAIVALVSSIIILIAAFRKGVLWGLGSLFVPFVSLVFVVMHWAEVRRAFFAHLASTAVLVGASFFFLPGFVQARTRAQHTETSDLTVQIEDHRRQIEKLEGQFAAQGAEVTRLYEQLTQKRASLKAGDRAATAAFNADVAAYQAKNTSQKAVQGQLAAERTELEALLAERSKITATKSPANASRVVMYSTADCPACQIARAYFARKKIVYEEHDVQTNAAARAEFQQMGGHGVPLIIVGTERMEGFSEQRLDALLGG